MVTQLVEEKPGFGRRTEEAAPELKRRKPTISSFPLGQLDQGP
jgi:hypothetical protein